MENRIWRISWFQFKLHTASTSVQGNFFDSDGPFCPPRNSASAANALRKVSLGRFGEAVDDSDSATSLALYDVELEIRPLFSAVRENTAIKFVCLPPFSGEYVEEGISGARDSRPQLNRLIADAHQRRFDVIVVWKFDRIARSVSLYEGS